MKITKHRILSLAVIVIALIWLIWELIDHQKGKFIIHESSNTSPVYIFGEPMSGMAQFSDTVFYIIINDVTTHEIIFTKDTVIINSK